jgi:hypothetical protein
VYQSLFSRLGVDPVTLIHIWVVNGIQPLDPWVHVKGIQPFDACCLSRKSSTSRFVSKLVCWCSDEMLSSVPCLLVRLSSSNVLVRRNVSCANPFAHVRISLVLKPEISDSRGIIKWYQSWIRIYNPSMTYWLPCLRNSFTEMEMNRNSMKSSFKIE